MLMRIVIQSTVSVIDLQNTLKKKRRSKLFMGFKSWGVNGPVAFFFL